MTEETAEELAERRQHDPFAPGDPQGDPFRIDRWQRAGASESELEELANAHLEMPHDVQAAEGGAIDRVSDNQLAEALNAMREEGDLTGYLVVHGVTSAPGAPVAPDNPSVKEAEKAAAEGEWKDREAIEIDGVQYKAWDLVGGYVGALIGDLRNGLHVMAKDEETLVARIKAHLEKHPATGSAPDVAAWQAAKHAKDAAARVKG